jgi:hypothetical protein
MAGHGGVPIDLAALRRLCPIDAGSVARIVRPRSLIAPIAHHVSRPTTRRRLRMTQAQSLCPRAQAFPSRTNKGKCHTRCSDADNESLTAGAESLTS